LSLTSSAWKVPLWVPIVLVDGGIDSLARLYIGDAVICRDVECGRRENGWLQARLMVLQKLREDRWQTERATNADE